MSRRTRIAVFLTAACVLAVLFGWAFAGLPAFGHYAGPYGYVLNRIAVPERHASNVVSATVFDYRSVDTMGEEFILLAAVTGVVLLLRSGGREREDPESTAWHGSDVMRVAGTLMVGAAFLVGLWLVAFGYVSPGGGFQGGVVLASAVALVYVATNYRTFEPFGKEEILDPVEAAGAGAYVIVGLAALVSGLPFLGNLLGPGEPKTLFSGGSIPLLNWAAALEVCAAILVLFSEFLREYVVPLMRSEE